MSKKETGLYAQLCDREFLERAADDAVASVRKKHGREPRYLTVFREKRKPRMNAIERMFKNKTFPKKTYYRKEVQNIDKTRELGILHFYPWSIILHAIKNVLEPILTRYAEYDCSAGMKGKGQVFAAERTSMMLRRYRGYTHFVVGDLRKYYLSKPHGLVRRTLRWLIDDEDFMEVVEKVILDYRSDIEDLLEAEWAKKQAYCRWADGSPFRHVEERGITIGGPTSQILGNIDLLVVDWIVKRRWRIKFYHRHCDDFVVGARSQEEGERILGALDRILNRMGLVLKASSFVAPIRDEKKGIVGRALDFCGYAQSRGNKRIRKITKQRMARKLKGLKSKRRRREIIAAYNGMMKWGKCKNLLKTILRQNGIMSFADVGIKTEKVRRDKDGKLIFDVPEEKISTLADRGAEIVVHNFESGVEMRGKPDRVVVLFRYAQDSEDKMMKFYTSSKYISDKLARAREMEKEKQITIFPQPTKVMGVRLSGGRHTYDLE